MAKHTPELIQTQFVIDQTHHAYISLGPRATDITGKCFGRLAVLGPIERTRRGQIKWLCRCVCGNMVIVARNNLVSGNTESCGCLRRELVGDAFRTHGMAKQPLSNVWHSVIQRCTNPNSKSYADYGGRGITICNEWRFSFQAFHDHVCTLPHYGEPGYTLDRIDNSLGYTSGNVRWATRSEQNRNTRNNRHITYNGETKCLSEWAHTIGISSGTLGDRLRNGWSIERALTQAVGKQGTHKQKA